MKLADSSTACVTAVTFKILIQRGWGTDILPISNPGGPNGGLFLFNNNVTSSKILRNGTLSSNATSSIQLPLGISTPTISSTKSGIKIISIEMSPDPLKVGDKPQFKMTYQNISDKVINYVTGCTASSLGYTLSPPDHVQEGPGPAVKCPNEYGPIQPNQTVSNYGRSHYLNGYYEIIKSGTLHVTLELLLNDEHDNTYLAETVQFDLNVGQ